MSDLSVVLDGDLGEEVVTHLVSDVQIRSVDPGGFASATLDLRVPISKTLFDRFGQVRIYNSRTGEQVGGGRLLQPGNHSLVDSDKIKQLSVLGEGIASMQDVKKPYILADSRLDGFHAGSSFVNATAWEQGGQPGTSESSGWLFQIRANDVGVGSRADLRYYPLARTGQSLGGFVYTINTGRSSSNNRTQAIVSYLQGAFTVPDIYDTNWTGSQVIRAAEYAAWDPETIINTLTLRYERVSSAIPPGGVEDSDWVHISNPRVLALRRDRDGSFITDAGTYANGIDNYTRAFVYAHEAALDIFNDAESIDTESARIDVTTSQFTQLAWPEGVTPYDALGEVVSTDGAVTWAAWEQQRNGKQFAEFRIRPTEARYIIPANDGFEPTLNAASNPRWLSGVWVVGTHSSGRPTALFFENPEIDLIPSEVRGKYIDTIDLGQTVFSEETAEKNALRHMADSLLAASAARLTVKRTVFDRITGRWVEPFMIRPGSLALVQGVRSDRDGLNFRSGADSTLFRIVSMNYTRSNKTTTLELNTYSPTETRELARVLRLVGAMR